MVLCVLQQLLLLLLVAVFIFRLHRKIKFRSMILHAERWQMRVFRTIAAFAIGSWYKFSASECVQI